MQRVEIKKSLDRSKNEKFSDTQSQFSVEYLPLRRPLGNSPTVWESVRSKPTPFALIILGLWPNWWKKTLLIIKVWVITTVKPYCNNCPAVQSRRRDFAEQQNYTLTYTQSPFSAAQLSRDDCHDNSRPILPNMHLTPCTQLPTQRLTSQLCMHDELCTSWEYTEKNHVMLRWAHTNLQ